MFSRFRITPDRAVLIGLFLTAAVYSQDLRYDFILDDVPLILLNSTISTWHNWKTLFLTDIFYFKESGIPHQALHYRPVFTLWLMLNRQVFGLILPWWHLTSLLLHMIVSVLVYELGIELLKDRWTAAIAALLFAFHPVHVESVAYVSVSTDLLATLFVLIAILSYIRFRKHASVGYLIVSVFAAALAMLSKETAAMLPWLIAANELFVKEHSSLDGWWKRFVWVLPFFGVVLVYSVIRTFLFGHNLWLRSSSANPAAVFSVPLLIVFYLRHLLVPFQLSFYYPVEWISHWNLWNASGLVLVIIAVVLLWNSVRNRQIVRLHLSWLAIMLVPAIVAIFTFVSGDSVHDRHLYMASVPICLIVANLLTDPKLSSRTTVTASSFVLGVLLLLTAFYVPTFSDEITLSKRAVEIAPRNVIARGDYAAALWSYGRHDEAFQQLRVMIDIAPQFPFGYEAYGAALAEIGRDEEAADLYRKALDRSQEPSMFRGWVLYHLGVIEAKHSQTVQAVEHLSRAVQIDPQNPFYHRGLSEALREEGRMNEASEELRLEAELRERLP